MKSREKQRKLSNKIRIKDKRLQKLGNKLDFWEQKPGKYATNLQGAP